MEQGQKVDCKGVVLVILTLVALDYCILNTCSHVIKPFFIQPFCSSAFLSLTNKKHSFFLLFIYLFIYHRLYISISSTLFHTLSYNPYLKLAYVYICKYLYSFTWKMFTLLNKLKHLLPGIHCKDLKSYWTNLPHVTLFNSLMYNEYNSKRGLPTSVFSFPHIPETWYWQGRFEDFFFFVSWKGKICVEDICGKGNGVNCTSVTKRKSKQFKIEMEFKTAIPTSERNLF